MAKQVLKRGSVVLVRYPFTDLSGSKVRPALALTPDDLLSQMDDALFLFISSTIPLNLLPTDFILKKDHPDFAQTGLHFDSTFRTHKLALLEKSLVSRHLGRVADSLMQEIEAKLRRALGL
jgi:mRNA interferase MazF